MTGYVRADRVRALLSVTREGRELAAANQDPRGHVLAGLARVLASEVGIRMTGRVSAGGIAIDSWLDYGWRTAREREPVYTRYMTAPNADPLVDEIVHAPTAFTLPVQSKMCDQSELHRPAGVDAALLSCVRAGADFRLLVFKRAWGVRVFDAEDCALVELFRGEIEPLLIEPPTAVALSRREREVLTLLLDGLPEKLVAARLSISAHTTHVYTKALYRKLGVHSRGELLARARRYPV